MVIHWWHETRKVLLKIGYLFERSQLFHQNMGMKHKGNDFQNRVYLIYVVHISHSIIEYISNELQQLVIRFCTFPTQFFCQLSKHSVDVLVCVSAN